MTELEKELGIENRECMVCFNGKPFNPLTIARFACKDGYRLGTHPYKIKLYTRWRNSLPWYKRILMPRAPSRFTSYREWVSPRVLAYGQNREPLFTVDGYRSNKHAHDVTVKMNNELGEKLKLFSNLRE